MANATCALCLRAIVTGEKFVIAETEVFHDWCAKTTGTHTSIGNQKRQRIATLEHNNRQLMNSVSEAQTTLRVLKDRVEEEMKRAIEAAEDQKQIAESWKRRYEQARADMFAVSAERDRLRTELAAANQRVAVAPPPQQQAPQPADTRDSTEIRFSLLEIDSD